MVKRSYFSNIKKLESESIHIIREVVAECKKPVLLYSIGKDSAVLLRLAQKAFYPSKLPFPVLHIDTTWKFNAMITFGLDIGLKAKTYILPVVIWF